MPQNGVSYESRRRETRRSTCKANGQVPSTGLVNGAIPHNGFPAAATRTNERAPAGTLNGTKPQCMANGYINHWYKGKSTKAAPPRTFGKQGSQISSAAEASAAGRVRRARSPGGISVNGANSLDSVALPCNSDRMSPEPSLSAAARTQRRRRCRRNKRDTKVVSQENPMMPPHVEEDWENDISQTDFSGWEKTHFGPYGPEDVLRSALRDQTLIASYSPAIHHAHPVQWSRRSIPTEPDQFADADE